MQRLFSILLLCMLAGPVYAQNGSMLEEDAEIRVLEEQDFDDIATMLKLEESIPVAEDNCIRVRKKKDICICENAHLYDEYSEALEALRARHPEWENQTFSYNFYQGGVTYEGRESYSSFQSFVDRVLQYDCEQMEY